MGPVSAVDATRGLAYGWVEAGHDVVERPMSDGAAELVESVRHARGGELVPVVVRAGVWDPDEQVPAALLHVPGRAGGTAYVETSAVLGWDEVGTRTAARLVREGTTEPVADLLVAAVETGAARVVVGLGESAVHDGGIGLLQRLGVLLGEAGGLAAVEELRHRLRHVQIDVAAATDRPLLGLHGAGAALAQLPGVGPAVAQEAERRVGALVDQVGSRPGPDGGPAPSLASRPRPVVRPTRDPGTGAGGGSAYVLAMLGGRILPGAEVVAAETALPELAGGVDLVVTGCTTLDGTAMHTGVVAAAGQAAMAYGVPVVAVGEQVQVSRRDGARVGVSATYPIRDAPTRGLGGQPGPPPGDPWDDIVRRGERIRRTWAL
ncbi:glycerate kinase [Ruania alkalisoli]|uniref:Glycerate kinase n=1 Tax=Ruania alkalisoli TaxID=2779775 RepID=A0A7M1SP08_9MICO|nr:glycerate kinase [Ruania alkalisoli]QOR69161.1 glycerate kinase [Ruania alkalisoli]